MKRLLVCLLLLLLAVPLLAARAAVVPPPTHQNFPPPPPIPANYNGTVRISGANVPAGCFISAWVNGVEAARALVDFDAVQGSRYRLNVAGDDPATDPIEGGTNGATITFVLELPDGGAVYLRPTSVWYDGAIEVLNLSFEPALVLPFVRSGS